MSQKSKRTFIKKSLLASGVLLHPLAVFPFSQKQEKIKLHVFSKHLQFLDTYEEMSDVLSASEANGADITVRPGGHVIPEKVEMQLPKVVDALQKNNLSSEMMTTAITNTKNPFTPNILQTASALGISYYRMGYLDYTKEKPIPEQLQDYKLSIWQLAKMNSDYKIHGAYQNHDGTRVGASLWDLWELLKSANAQWIGSQFDIRHATVEGAKSWKNDLRLLQEYVKTVVVKDFIWEKRNNQWKIKNVPIGEGMVNFKAFFELLKSFGFNGPISVHFEYPLPPKDTSLSKTEIRKQTIEIIKRDLTKVRDYLKQAGFQV